MSDNSRVSRRAKKTNNKKHMNKFLKWFLIVIGGLFVLAAGTTAYLASSTPEVNKSILQSAGSTTFYDRNNKKVMDMGIRRDYVKYNEIPKKMQDAVISIEDRRFYKEPFGIDPIRIASVLFGNISSQSIQGGGSTLTQQLVKLSVFSTNKSDQTIKRKIQEILLAIKIENKFSKHQILEFYINKVYLANGIAGMKTAAKYYFGKDLNQLSLAQTAQLAGIPQSPYAYDPYVYPEKAKTRRDSVLNAMYRNKKISKDQLNNALNEPISEGLKPKEEDTTSASRIKKISDPYIKEAISTAQKKGFDPYRDNLKITLNLDLDAQERLYNIINSYYYIGFPDDLMQAAATVVNSKNGQVIAMVGGRNQGEVQLGYNRAVEKSRSNGSNMKPLLDYAPAMEYLGWSTYHPLVDERYTYPGTDINLQNWDHTYMGKMTLRNALSQSRNVPAVKTLQSVGFDKARKFIKKMNIDVPKSQGLSAAIGSNVSTLQSAAAYGSFSDDGNYHKPYYISKIETADGITHTYDSKPKKVMSSSTAFMITDILKNVVDSSGMANSAYIPGLAQAGKTGTTNYSDEELEKNPYLADQSRDAWFTGYTKDYSMSVWTGYDKPIENGLDQDSQKLSQLIYKYMISYLEAGKSVKDWTMPNSLVTLDGEYFLKGTVPAYIDNSILGNLNSSGSVNQDDSINDLTTGTDNTFNNNPSIDNDYSGTDDTETTENPPTSSTNTNDSDSDSENSTGTDPGNSNTEDSDKDSPNTGTGESNVKPVIPGDGNSNTGKDKVANRKIIRLNSIIMNIKKSLDFKI